MAEEKIKLLPEIEQLTEKLLADPKSRVFAQLADAYRKCGMLDEAIDTAKKGLEIHPQYAVAHLILGRCYMAKKMYALAREEFELTVKNDPQNILGYRLLAETYERQSMYPEAVKYYQMVLDLEPADIDIAEKIENLKASARTEPPAPPYRQMPETPPEPKAEEPAPPAPPEAAAAQIPAPPSAAEPEAPQPAAEPAALEERAPSEPEPAPPPSEPQAQEGPAGNTATIAELYASQGHFERAIEVYRELIAAEPENQSYKQRMDELLAKAFPEIGPEPGLEPTAAASREEAAPVETSPASTAAAAPVEEQAVELTGMFAEMERLAAVAEPQPPKEETAEPKLDSLFSLGDREEKKVEEPAAAALSALFAEEPPPPPEPKAEKQPEPQAPPEEEKPKDSAVSSFQAWLNSIQK